MGGRLARTGLAGRARLGVGKVPDPGTAGRAARGPEKAHEGGASGRIAGRGALSFLGFSCRGQQRTLPVLAVLSVVRVVGSGLGDAGREHRGKENGWKGEGQKTNRFLKVAVCIHVPEQLTPLQG